MVLWVRAATAAAVRQTALTLQLARTHALWHRRMVLPEELPTSVCMERVITPRLSHTIFRSVAEADAVRHAGGAVPYWD